MMNGNGLISVEDGCQTRAAITSDSITVVFVPTTCSIMVVIIPLVKKITICNRPENEKQLNHLLLDKS